MPYHVDVAPLPAGAYTVELRHRYAPSHGTPLARFPLTITPGFGRLRDGHFDLQVTWRTVAGQEGTGELAREPTRDSAIYYFFSPENWELMVKVLDGRHPIAAA